MKRVLFRIFLLCTILTLFVACGSESAPEPEDTTEQPVVEATTEPSSVEPESVVTEPTTDWASVNAGKISAVEEARKSAVASGAAYFFKDYFDGVDAEYAEALAAYEAGGDPEKFSKTADEYVNFYNAFANLGSAQGLCNLAYAEGYDVYDEKNAALGQSLFDELEALAAEDSVESEAVLAKSEEILAAYEQLVENGEMIDEIVVTYLAAEEAGAAELFPGDFEAVADLGYEALAYYNTEGTQEELEADADNLLNVAQAFNAACKANDVYNEIYDRGFDAYDVKDIAAGDAAVDDIYEIVDAYYENDVLEGKKLNERVSYVLACYNQAFENGIAIEDLLETRDAAVAVGADEIYPVEFAIVDESCYDSLDYFNNGGSQDEFDADVKNYKNLYVSFAKAIALEDKYDYILAKDFDKFDTKNFEAGLALVDKVYDLAETMDGAEISSTLDQADEKYTKVINNGHNIAFVLALRENALNYGAYDYYPVEFDYVDATAEAAIVYYNEDGTQEELDDDIEEASYSYNALITAVDTQDAYTYIIANGYDEIDTKSVAAGDAAVAEVDELIEAPVIDSLAVFEKINVALDCYDQAISNSENCLAIMALRDEAVEAGAEDRFPEEFAAVDEMAWDAVDYYNAGGSQAEFDADVENFKNVYEAFIVAVHAGDAYDVVIEEGYDYYDVKNFEIGNEGENRVYDIAYTTFDGSDLLVAIEVVDDAYNQVVDNGQMIDEVIAVRESAIDEGAEEYFPYELSVADEYAYEAIDYYNDMGTQEELEADAENFKNVYEAFREAAVAANLYVRIVENDFQSYDRNGFAAAEKATDELEDLAYSLPEGDVLLAKAIEVREGYDKVVKNAFKKKSDGVRSEYLTIKRDADGIKASVADKQGYSTAETHMKNADAMFARMSYESAFNEYTTAEEQMRSVYESVLAKRNAAIEALERGRARAEELSILAAQADIIAPLSDN